MKLKLRIYKLNNGLTVYLAQNEDAPRIQTYIPVRAGSNHDPSDNTGLAHYLEHMMFKGTSFQSQIIPEEFNSKINDMAFVMKVQIALKQFGYGITETGVWDDATKKTIEAFQYHFRPQNYDGKIDIETWAILQALIQKYPNK